jgi:hypothetical protein
MKIEFDANEYRTLEARAKELEWELADIRARMNNIEKNVFASLDMFETYKADEFLFRVMEGRRSMTPAPGWDEDWRRFLADPAKALPLDAVAFLSGLIEKVPAHVKAPTLAESDKRLKRCPELAPYLEEAKIILGYNAGGRQCKVERVKV